MKRRLDVGDAVDLPGERDGLGFFGLWLGFHKCSQDDYLDMIDGYVRYHGLEIDAEQLRAEALEWATTRGSRSGRVAWQFTQDLAGRLGKPLRD